MKEKTFGFNGIALTLPAAWELQSFYGNREQGRLGIDNGEDRVLEASWAPCAPASLDSLAAQTLEKEKDMVIRQRSEKEPHRGFYRLRHGERDLAAAVVLLPREQRCVVLRMTKPRGDYVQVLRRMTNPLFTAEERDDDEWAFFATRFILPKAFRLTEAQLQTGCMLLQFRRDKRRLTLWDLSLLDYIEDQVGATACINNLLETSYRKRFTFALPDLPAGQRIDSLARPGRHRGPLLQRPFRRLFGNRLVRLYAWPNRESNRLAVALFRYRYAAEEEWLAPLAASLRTAEEQVHA